MVDVLGLELSDEVLPMANFQAAVSPYLLDSGLCLVCRH
jgi:hypothetical protein